MSGFLREHKDAVLHAWEARVTVEAREVELVGLALRDDIPGLLDDLAGRLEGEGAPESSPLAARSLAHVMQRAVEAGFERHLAKPPSLEMLGQLLAQVPRSPAIDAAGSSASPAP